MSLTSTSNSLKIRVDYYQESPYHLQTQTLSLSPNEDNETTLTNALVPAGVKLNRAAIEVINRCLMNGDITTFVYRINNTLIRACKLKGSFYTQQIEQKPVRKCYESIYHREDVDKPHQTERVNTSIVPLADVFKRSNLTALAYHPEHSMFFRVLNRHKEQVNSIPPAWLATKLDPKDEGTTTTDHGKHSGRCLAAPAA